ncbi:hypothetical protein GCM10022403_056550 [Streptomyces coacervatus]|uniref:Uncharacterized protein n=1 Tax=Streptomyces coacervatus TaxID=647381 RepID=A0ABP7IDE6_9ACTN|nr:hypothetical protein [Streptomyces coacervatus]MDF2268981.1 hypothetical protein [Streptomyces coacervatus]
MDLRPAATALLEGEARALLTRLNRVTPFALHETMVPAASPSAAAQSAIERFLMEGRARLRGRVGAYLEWLDGPGGERDPEWQQHQFSLLRWEFNSVLTHFDLFQEAVTQRSERDVGVQLAGLDVAAVDALTTPGTPLADPPPIVCYLARGPGGAIRRVHTRIPGGGRSPVSLIRIPRERMVGYGIGASLVHEVGHQAVAQLGLLGSLRPVLYDIERHARTAAERTAFRYWGLTLSEVLADLFAVGKLGIGGTLGLMAVVSLPRRLVLAPALDDPHPFPYIRVRLSCALGDALYPHPQWGELSALWATLYPPHRAPRELRRLTGILEGSMPRFVRLLAGHRPPSLSGARLADLMPRSSHTPALLLSRYRRWVRRPALLRTAPPTLVFAVLGQARAASLITPEEESRLLGELIAHWALSSTLDALAFRGAGLHRYAAPPRGATSHDGAADKRQPIAAHPAERSALDSR